VDENRRSALHFAAAMNKVDLVQRLLAAEAEVDLADKDGECRSTEDSAV
jgi:ankyrin repeat protein